MFFANIVNGILHLVNLICYNKDVAERHIPKCKEIKAKPKPPRKKTAEVIL